MSGLSGFQNGAALLYGIVNTVDLNVNHIHFVHFPLSYFLEIALNLQVDTQAPHFTHFEASICMEASLWPGAV